MKKVVYICLIAMLFVACNESREHFNLAGDCEVLALALNDYEAVLDSNAATAKVMLPQGYSKDALTITRLDISEGAQASFQVGDVLNLREAKRLIVRNGDVYRDWNIYAFNEAAEITYFDLDGLYPGNLDK